MSVKTCSFSILFFVFCLPSWSQYLELEPTADLEMILPMDVTQLGFIYVTNITEDTLSIEWRKVGNTCPVDDWHMEFCDNIHCWDHLPNGDVMAPVEPGGSGFLKLIANAQNVSGSGTVSYWVFREGHMEEHIDCFFHLHTEDLNSVNDITAINGMTTWNAATKELSVTSNRNGIGRIYDLSGSVIRSFSFSNSTTTISLDELSTGIYIVHPDGMDPVRIAVR